MLLQHLLTLGPSLNALKSDIKIVRINCFDYPHSCADFNNYPNLIVYLPKQHGSKRLNFTYDGPIEGGRLLKTLLL